jgi:hypothetical protein
MTQNQTSLAGVLLMPVKLGMRVAGALLGRVMGGNGGEPPEEPREQPRREPGPDPQRDQRPKALDDVAITRKVETIIFRQRGVQKGKIDVNTADGVVWLRGQAKTPQQIKTLERKALEVPEVVRVENLLHLPNTPAPSRTDTPPSQRKTRRSRPPNKTR